MLIYLNTAYDQKNQDHGFEATNEIRISLFHFSPKLRPNPCVQKKIQDFSRVGFTGGERSPSPQKVSPHNTIRSLLNVKVFYEKILLDFCIAVFTTDQENGDGSVGGE